MTRWRPPTRDAGAPAPDRLGGFTARAAPGWKARGQRRDVSGHVGSAPVNDSVNRRRRPAELRGRLLDAGRDLFAEQGYPATTQRQIASAAGVSPSVLFRNFGSKSQLLRDIVIVLPTSPGRGEFRQRYESGSFFRYLPMQGTPRNRLTLRRRSPWWCRCRGIRGRIESCRHVRRTCCGTCSRRRVVRQFGI
jgi:Bacterial regulatory proteins, tetR family